MMPDWSLLSEELLHIISTHLEDCFDVIHARSVCTLWQFIFPFPSFLLRPSYSLPTFAKFPYVSEDLCTLGKFPLFLFRVKTPQVASTSEYFLGGIGRDDHTEFSSSIQCSVKVNIPKTEPTFMNMQDCQILPLGHQYRMIGHDSESCSTNYRGVAFISLNKEKGEFVVLVNYFTVFLVLRSVEMRWMVLKQTSISACSELIAFKGKFYATYGNGDIFVFDPYTLKPTPLKPSQPLKGCKYFVRYGDDDDELFLVEHYNPFLESKVIQFGRFVCRVSMLDEKAGKWVEVSDLEDRVLFIGHYGNVSWSTKELSDGCGLSGNSIVFTKEPGIVTYAYKYGVDTGREEDRLDCWRTLRENRVTILSSSPVVADRESHMMQLITTPLVAFRVEH